MGFLFFHLKPKTSVGGVGEGGKSSSRWVVVGVGEFQPPGGGGEEIADAGGRRYRRRGRDRRGEGGVATADGGRGSDLQQMGWLPSTILPFLAPFIAISSYL